MFSKEFDLKIDFEPNDLKIKKTINRTIRNTIYLLGLNIPYQLTLCNFCYNKKRKKVRVTAPSNHDALFELYKLDAIIRNVDDCIDNVLAKARKINTKKMFSVIKKFRLQLPEATAVAELFETEVKLMHQKSKNPKALIRRTVEVRPADFFLLSQHLQENFPTKLDKTDWKAAKSFYKEYHRLRDVIDDIISIDEDTSNNNYNLVIQSKKHKLKKSFIEEIVNNKLKRMKEEAKKIDNKKTKIIYEAVILFWEKEYKLIFKPLLNKYYKEISEFRKMYFYVK